MEGDLYWDRERWYWAEEVATKASTEGKGCGGGIRIEGRAAGREGWVERRER